MNMTDKPTLPPRFHLVHNLKSYAQELIQHGATIITAEKSARIAARPGVPGECIVSWSVDASGVQLLEKSALVPPDAENGISAWVATKVDESGTVIIDSNGHCNQWIIDRSTFQKKYTPDSKHPGIFLPVGSRQQFVRVNQAIHVLQWGQECRVDAGGYINITTPGDYYVISERDFQDTYRIVR